MIETLNKTLTKNILKMFLTGAKGYYDNLPVIFTKDYSDLPEYKKILDYSNDKFETTEEITNLIGEYQDMIIDFLIDNNLIKLNID